LPGKAEEEKNLDIQCPNQESDQAPPEYKSEALLFEQTCFVLWLLVRGV
jgi:hypothetical protein